MLRPRKQKKKEESRSQVKVKISESTYQCNMCGRLVIGETTNIFRKDADVCNQCVINSDQPEERVVNKELKEAVANLSACKIKSLSEVNKDAHRKYLIILDEQGIPSLNMVIRVEK